MSTHPVGRIQGLFDEVVDLTPAARAAHLKDRCGDDVDLLRQIESLVAAYQHVSTSFAPSGRSRLSPLPPEAAEAAPLAPLPTHRRYRITREVGRGGMGVVYLATDLQLDRNVALKFLPASSSADPDARRRLFAEARAAAMLDHPNIATIYDVGESDEGRLFIAMAFCPGESLRSRLERGPLPHDDAVAVAVRVAEGLRVAHSRGLVHRDIKPANLLLTAPDLVKIVDFGIAERIDSEATRAGELAGTMAYMSPEQARGEPVDARTDLWSLGVVLYEMLVGYRPLAGDSPVSLLHAILHEAPARLPDRVPDPAGALQRILDRALAKNRDERYATAEALIDDLRRIAAPDVRRAAIPAYLTSFVGRQREMRAARSAVLSGRLVTLTGAPGTGKTRLAIQLAADMRSEYPDGQVLVALSTVEDPALLPSAIAQALGLRGTGNRPVLDAVKDHLADRRLLLILDNFEQLLPAAPIVADLVVACRRLTVLVTSRASLRLSGEREFNVPPLVCPAPDTSGSIDEIAASEAVALFVQRAAAIQPGFEADEQSMRAIAEICRRLDGLPLAIELAAARVKVLPPRAILTRLESRLDLLKGGARDVPSRHQTLRQAIAWSYGLLDAAERKLLRHLAVFAGGFTFEAAERLAAGQAGVNALEGVASLVDNNLLHQVSVSGPEPRFAMFETIREFSLECLRAGGEEAQARRAHQDYYLAAVERMAADFAGPGQAGRFDELEQEHDNLRSAFEWSLASADLDAAERIAAGLWRFWLVRGHLREGRERLRRVLAITDTPSLRRLSLLTAAGTLAHNTGDCDAAREFYQQAVGMARSLGDEAATAGALTDLGWVAWRQGDYAGSGWLSLESLALHRGMNDARGAARALNNLGWVAHHEGDYLAAEAFHRQSLELREAAGDSRAIGFSIANLAWALLQQGQIAASRRLLARARALLEEVGERQLFAFAGVILGACERASGDPAKSLEILEHSAAVFRRIGDRYGVAAAQNASAMAAADVGDRERAASLVAESLLLRRQIGDRWGEAESLALQARLADAEGRRAEAVRLWQQALALWGALGDRASVAECLVRLATAAAATDPAAAGRLERAAGELRAALASAAPGQATGEVPCDPATVRDPGQSELDDVLRLAAAVEPPGAGGPTAPA
jgi:predicted ATPase